MLKFVVAVTLCLLCVTCWNVVNIVWGKRIEIKFKYSITGPPPHQHQKSRDSILWPKTKTFFQSCKIWNVEMLWTSCDHWIVYFSFQFWNRRIVHFSFPSWENFSEHFWVSPERRYTFILNKIGILQFSASDILLAICC